MLKHIITLSLAVAALLPASAQDSDDRTANELFLASLLDLDAQLPADSVFRIEIPEPDTTLAVDDVLFPLRFFGRPVYTGFNIFQNPAAPFATPADPSSPFFWIERANLRNLNMNRLSQNMMFAHPDAIIYNEATLPEPPKEYIATVDPSTAKIEVEEQVISVSSVTDVPEKAKVERRNWLNSFNGNIQFSQAFVSPNWYQGGNNNLNAIAQAIYNVKLNQAFHPDLLFDNTIQYKLGITRAPEDEFRDYSISEDLFQANTKFGFKAWKHWFYSLTGQFKTQFLHNYITNTQDLKASFLSPGELNVGVGMTYDYTNPKKTFSFNASIAPFSYNMKMCLSNRIDPTSFGIEAGRHYSHEYGSNLEAKLAWKMSYNITYSSRLFAFTDYGYVQGDWENTFQFDVNKFLSTQLYVHVRYDSQTPFNPGSKWHHWQLKEILSFGFSYRFATPGL